MYARKACVATEQEDNSIIWFHDYHLLTGPNFVRRQMSTAQIGLFVHTVWPTSEVFRCLPTRVEILRGMLSSDLIGFHMYDYCRHFLSAVKRILDLDFHTLPRDGTLQVHILGRDVSLRIGHVSIRGEEIQKRSQSNEVQQIAQKFIKRFCIPTSNNTNTQIDNSNQTNNGTLKSRLLANSFSIRLLSDFTVNLRDFTV